MLLNVVSVVMCIVCENWSTNHKHKFKENRSASPCMAKVFRQVQSCWIILEKDKLFRCEIILWFICGFCGGGMVKYCNFARFQENGLCKHSHWWNFINLGRLSCREIAWTYRCTATSPPAGDKVQGLICPAR